MTGFDGQRFFCKGSLPLTQHCQGWGSRFSRHGVLVDFKKTGAYGRVFGWVSDGNNRYYACLTQ